MKTTPFIQNTSAIDVKMGTHKDASINSMLIQITEPAGWRVEPNNQFREIYHFEFLDADGGFPEECLISDDQAVAIAKLLTRALANNTNVIVHCVAGIARSGAVAEVGVMMGFTDTKKYRQPNVRVKTKLMNALGLGYAQ